MQAEVLLGTVFNTVWKQEEKEGKHFGALKKTGNWMGSLDKF